MTNLILPHPNPSARASVHCDVLTDFAAVEALSDEWLELLQRSDGNEPMLSPFWLNTWWEHYGADRELRVIRVYDETGLIGLLPLQRRRYWYRPGIPFWRLEFLGADVDEHDGVCSEYLNLIVEAGREADVLAACRDLLRGKRLGPWNELVLSALDGEHPLTAGLQQLLPAAEATTEIVTLGEAPYIPLPDSWEAYLKALGKHRRYVNKSLRDFDDWATGQATFHQADTWDDVIHAKSVLHQLHGKRWQQAGDDGVFASPRFTTFHDEMMARLHKRGALQLHWLEVRGQPVAAVYNICWNHKVYFYQSGRTMDVPNKIRLGIVLHAHCIQAAIAAGLREYDFLLGATQYKQKLSLASRRLVQLRMARPSWRERLRLLARRGIRAARALWRAQHAWRDKS